MKGKQVSAQALGLAVAAILAWAFQAITKIVIPAEIAVALGTICSVAASIIIPDDMEVE
jgi:hypothetical protein